MPPVQKFPLRIFILLTALPAIVIGATLWIVSDLVPVCTIEEQDRLTSPGQQFDLVVFSRDCGNHEANTQAALVPPGDEVPFDAASFFSIAADADLSARWLAADSIEITRPASVAPLRDDASVAGVTVTYK
ncbi:hypothetical protein ASD83_00340 [Devosia sp. Root685]|uniref:hypothetical protein n=1 Tax=Devosia sp. Root685 TaxID=1736587 RepID=UPI0006F6AAE0|nr:hypothetical protein [Devosia sp. Root685]KRA99029.1 hypothetical protein ASD83_00340 [Devosia sp. Root685]